MLLIYFYAAYGNSSIAKPILQLSTNETNGAESINLDPPLIILEEKAFDICKAMEDDFHNSLAFILGHELAHCIQGKNKKHSDPVW